jgi:hypothetical protein
MTTLCIFCHKRANSKEHLWPKWLVDSVVQDRSSKIEMMFANRPDVIVENGKYVTCRCVCKECNEGWMGDLEADIKPILEPLMYDSSSPLDYLKQLALSIWTTKTAIVYECVKGEGTFYAPADRQHLLAWRMPPPDTLIWIGRYENSFSLFVENHYLSNPENTNVLSEGCVTTFAMGRFVIQIFTARRSPQGEGLSFNVVTKEGEWGRLLIQIWPVLEQVVRWPPALSFGPSEEKLHELAKRFSSGP